MADVFSTPEEIKVPEIDWSNFNRDEYENDIERFYAELRVWIKQHLGQSKDPTAGKIIKFPMGDGYAQYMVITTKGNMNELFYLALDDCWEYPHIGDITAKTVKEKIKQDEAMAKLFGH